MLTLDNLRDSTRTGNKTQDIISRRIIGSPSIIFEYHQEWRFKI